MGNVTGTASVIANVRAALSAGWEVVRPTSRAAAAAVRQPRVRAGVLAIPKIDMRPGFVSEKDFVELMLSHNITVCDLGEPTHEPTAAHQRPNFLYKGAAVVRKPGTACSDVAQRWLEGKPPRRVIVVPGKLVNLVPS